MVRRGSSPCTQRVCACIALLALLAIVLPFKAVQAQATSFPDMANSWYRYREAVAFLEEKKVISGYEDGIFRPKQIVNRAEFLKLVFAARSDITPTAGRCFKDVRASAWYAPYVCAAKRREIIHGYPDGTFKPEQEVNMAEAIKMLLEAYGHEVASKPGADWYEPYVQELDRSDVLPRSSYLAGQPLTRERAADLIVRVLRHDEERIIPNLSPGCGKAAPDATTNVTANGTERSYLLTVPRRYVSHDPAPLIIAFHGRTNSNAQVRAYFGLDREADKFFIAYPAALQKDTGTFHWSDPGDKGANLRDVVFFDEIVQQIGERYCIDLDRIFVVGHSLGAWMANSVACARGGIVRGSATVGGNSVLTDCPGPAAALIINNPDDALSPHKSAELTRDQRLRENACGTQSASVPPSSLACVSYTDCNRGSEVVWCPHTIDRTDSGLYYPHLWPDDAAKAMVDFFDGL